MPNNEQLTRLGIFASVGYLCAGSLVTLLAGLSLWGNYLQISYGVISLVTIFCMLIGGGLGILVMRLVIPHSGVRKFFEQDILVFMIGMLLLALSINDAMFFIGVLVSSASLSVYFYANFNVQVEAARIGGMSIMTLAGWALGPIISIFAIVFFSQYELLTVRVICAHFIVLSFWVWVQRLGLHTQYDDAPEFVLKLEQNSPYLNPAERLTEKAIKGSKSHHNFIKGLFAKFKPENQNSTQNQKTTELHEDSLAIKKTETQEQAASSLEQSSSLSSLQKTSTSSTTEKSQEDSQNIPQKQTEVVNENEEQKNTSVLASSELNSNLSNQQNQTNTTSNTKI